MKGDMRLCLVLRQMMPSCDISLVREAMCGAPFEPLHEVDLRIFSVTTALLLALMMTKRVNKLHILSVNPACAHSADNDA